MKKMYLKWFKSMVDVIYSERFIKGNKADYNPNRYFEYQGVIYMKMKFEDAYDQNFIYPKVDVVRDRDFLKWY